MYFDRAEPLERSGTVSKNILLEGLKQFHGRANLILSSDVDQDTYVWFALTNPNLSLFMRFNKTLFYYSVRSVTYTICNIRHWHACYPRTIISVKNNAMVLTCVYFQKRIPLIKLQMMICRYTAAL